MKELFLKNHFKKNLSRLEIFFKLKKLIMKKILLVVLILFGTDVLAQQMAYNVVYVRAEENSEWQIGNLIETYYTDNKRKSGGVVLEKLRHGRPKGMTHRIVWLWELGKSGMADGELSEYEQSNFRSQLRGYVEEWGMSYSGRMINWVEGDMRETPYIHIWDITPEDPTAFQKAHKEFIESVPEVFGGRFNGFGTYDINQPNGATHWVLVSGKDLDDHLQLLHNLETKYPAAMQKFGKERGETTIVHDFTFENLKYITTE
tara:strand:- start:640 stop:1419 length:780 start_codon:yes stop_codon:yes gene_type:complete